MSILFGVLLTLHIIVCLALVGVILLQRSEGGALGMGGGGGSGFMTARGAGNLLTRSTSVLGGLFFALSLTLTLIAGGRSAVSVTEGRDLRVDPSRINQPLTPPVTPGLPGEAPAEGAAATAPGLSAPLPTVRRAEPAAPAPGALAAPTPAGPQPAMPETQP